MVIHHRFRHPALAIVAALSCFAVLFSAGCNDDGKAPAGSESPAKGPGPEITRPEPAGVPRQSLLGFSSLPPERTSDSYIQAFATAAQYADVVLVQRTPPWEDFMPGGQVSKQTADSTRIETSLLDQYRPLKLFYAIDPTDGVVQRSRPANLPPDIDPQIGFRDGKVQDAFVAYAAYVAKNYKPDYMALGVEVNMTFERAPEQFEAFVAMYVEAYDVVKGNSPNTRVFPTFQLEDLEGAFGVVHPPRWDLFQVFEGRMDVLAISTYPFLGEARSAADVRGNYYSQLKDHWPGEIIISETGYPSAPVEGRVTVGTESDQQAYVDRLLREADDLGIELVVWFAALDPAFASTGTTAVFKDIGLRKSDGSNKLAWTTWEEWARRPIAK